MTVPSLRMSQTGKILVGLLLAAAAVFFWANFFVQNGLGGAPSATARPAESAPATAPAAALPGDAAGADDAAGTPGVAAAPSVTAVAPDAGAPTRDAPGAPVAVEVAPPLEVTTRDLVVSDLPFLLTEPVAAPVGAAPTADGEVATGANRPGSAQRATINPFSPVVVQGGQQAAQARQPVAEPVTEVAVPSAPQPTVASTPEPIAAPAPAALAPPSPRARDLPRALPAGTLPSTPEILRSARAAPEPLAVSDVIGATGVREPAAPGPELAAVDRAPVDATASAGDLAPLGPSGQRAAAGPAAGDPLAAGVTPLSAYLRNNNVAFTGSVLGPVSVGVFRSALSRTPIVIALGSALPETDIVLTDLRGQQAQFTQDDATQTLTLNLRR